ncbi:MAG: peptidase T, partial [Oscillospiraceae bacterium]|nr:peptidase T [Oscillospiraceae bacterium]
YDTTSDRNSDLSPSTAKQLVLGKEIVDDMKALGIDDARLTDKGVVYGTINATKGYEDKPCIGFLAHMDTAQDISGTNVVPRIIENYDGGDVAYPKSDIVLSPKQFPRLKQHVGKTLIVTDGSTLLGADNKAGIVEILEAVDILHKNSIPHGKIAIGFTPDEEIGRGVDNFSVSEFGAEYAYTVDGGDIEELEYECFNAASLRVMVKGFNIHPGTAKNRMKNASLIAFEFDSMLPVAARPQFTEGYEGFYHLSEVEGNEDRAELRYIIRDHDKDIFESRKMLVGQIADFLNSKYGDETVTVEVIDSYYNMREIIQPRMYIVDNAKAAMREAGIEPIERPIRGGTDGSRLSFMGLPCPNLPSGGANYHGILEYITVEDMYKATDIIVNIIKGV